MNLAVHGIDVVFLVIAAIVFLLAAFTAIAFIEPRVMKVIYGFLSLGLLLLTLSFLIKGLDSCHTRSRVTAGAHIV